MAKYHSKKNKLETDLRARVLRGEWATGALIPSRAELAREYQVAVNTIQQAIIALVTDGLLRVEPNRGTFVAYGHATGQPVFVRATENTPLLSLNVPSEIQTLGIIAGSREPSSALRRPSEAEWDPYIIRSLENAFAQYGGHTVFYLTDVFPTLTAAMQRAIADGVKALVVINMYDTGSWEDEVIACYDVLPIPLMYISSTDVQAPVPHLYYDQRITGYQAGMHLLQMGYRQLAFVSPFSAPWVDARFAGVRLAAQHMGISPDAVISTPDPSPIPISTFIEYRTVEQERLVHEQLERIFDAMRLRESPAGACALVGANDFVGYTTMREIIRLGIDPGRGAGVIGFDDTLEARQHGMSSIRPPLEDLGESAAKMLWRALHGESAPVQTSLLSNLVPRNSTNRATMPRGASEIAMTNAGRIVLA